MEWMRELEQQVGEPEEFAAGEWIYEEGEHGTLLFLLLAGAVELTRGGQVYSRIGPLAVFGEEVAFGEEIRLDGAVAAGPVRVLPLGPARLTQLSIRRTNVLADLQSLARHRRALRGQTATTATEEKKP
jgi:CRP-like cAMP-binding protein